MQTFYFKNNHKRAEEEEQWLEHLSTDCKIEGLSPAVAWHMEEMGDVKGQNY